MEEIREQPTMEPANVSIETGEVSAASEVGSQTVRQVEKPEQSEFGKFKNAESLLTAYNNLEAEFTKKCQRLSELEKEQAPTAAQSLEEFLSNKQEARPFADKLQALATESKNGSYEGAWERLVYESLTKGDTSDPIISHYILSNNELKEKIVEDYLNALNNNKPPIIISSQKGERVSSVKPDTPTSLAEAKKMVEKMFS